MEKVIVKSKTITPMFLSGEDQSNTEFRMPSIKGLLRFWWRALNFTKPEIHGSLTKLKEKEARIFGDASEGLKSSFSIKPLTTGIQGSGKKFPDHPVQASPSKTFKINILEYLCYGTYDYVRGQGNQFRRQYIPENTSMDFEILFKDPDTKKDVLESLYYLTVFGGIGSRSHNGFGNILIINANEIFKSLGQNYLNPYPVKNLFKDCSSFSNPSFTAFSGGTRIFRMKNTFGSWDKALAELGKIYRGARNALEPLHQFEKRQYIGSPIIERWSQKSFLDRRSKPYYLKIILENNKYHPYIIYFPSTFCDGLEKNSAGKRIDHNKMDADFTKYCNEFNSILLKSLEEVK